MEKESIRVMGYSKCMHGRILEQMCVCVCENQADSEQILCITSLLCNVACTLHYEYEKRIPLLFVIWLQDSPFLLALSLI